MSIIDDKDYSAQSVCANNWLFACLYKSLPSTCCVDFDIISLFILKFYIHIALYILYSENYHQLSKH